MWNRRQLRGTRPGRDRRGALLSFELLMLLPLLVGLALGCAEFVLILRANQQVKEASHVACRLATRPCHDPQLRATLVERAVHRSLAHPRWIQLCEYEYQAGRRTGDAVRVKVRLPMEATAPDLLALVGFSIRGRFVQAETVMAHE